MYYNQATNGNEDAGSLFEVDDDEANWYDYDDISVSIVNKSRKSRKTQNSRRRTGMFSSAINYK